MKDALNAKCEAFIAEMRGRRVWRREDFARARELQQELFADYCDTVFTTFHSDTKEYDDAFQ